MDWMHSGNALLTGGLLVGVIAAFWVKIKALASRILGLLVITVEYQHQACLPMVRWVNLKGRRMPGAMRWFSSHMPHVRPRQRRWPVLYEVPSTESALVLIGWRPLWLAYKSTNQQQQGNTDHYGDRLVVHFFRWTFDPERLGFEAVESFGAQLTSGNVNGHRYDVTTLTGSGRRKRDIFTGNGDDSGKPALAAPPNDLFDTTTCYRLIGYKPDDIGEPIETSPFLGLYYPPEIEAAMVEVERWLKSKDWYKAKGIPWRRSFLLCGAPGNGKSRLVRAMAQRYDLPVYVFDLATMDNQELDMYWHKAMANAPCFAVFEDLDGIFNNRINVLGENSTLTFDKFLQCLSGVAASDGVFVVITTNRPELLSDAIGKPAINERGTNELGESTRPGRVDRVIELGPPGDTEREQILRFILGDAATEQEIKALTSVLKDKSAAQVSELAARIALERYWEKPSCVPGSGGCLAGAGGPSSNGCCGSKGTTIIPPSHPTCSNGLTKLHSMDVGRC